MLRSREPTTRGSSSCRRSDQADPVGDLLRAVRPVVGGVAAATRPGRCRAAVRAGATGASCADPAGGDRARAADRRRWTSAPTSCWRDPLAATHGWASTSSRAPSRPSPAWTTRSIDMTKGCFLGQESVAKVRNLGHPTDACCATSGAEAEVEPGAPVHDPDGVVGRVTERQLRHAGEARSALVRVAWAAPDAALSTGDGRTTHRPCRTSPFGSFPVRRPGVRDMHCVRPLPERTLPLL